MRPFTSIAALIMSISTPGKTAPGVLSSYTQTGIDYRVVFENINQPLRSSFRPLLVAAPHGDHDFNTRQLAIRVCQSLGAECLTARAEQRSPLRLNVNRPTVGAGQRCSEEKATYNSQTVFNSYQKEFNRRLYHGGMKGYVEIHGNDRALRPGTVGRIEVGVSRTSAEQARRIKEVFQRARGQVAGMGTLEVQVEGVDQLELAGNCAEKIGVLGRAPRALHLEISNGLRQTKQIQKTIDYLSRVLRALGPDLVE